MNKEPYNHFWWHLESHLKKEQDPSPDPYSSDTDPRIQAQNARHPHPFLYM